MDDESTLSRAVEFLQLGLSAAVLLLTAVTAWGLSRRYGSQLRALPGPLVASITDFWRFWQVWLDAMPHVSLDLHKKHGPLVRLGPNYVSASSPEAVHVIYRAGTGFTKSRIYGMLQPQLDGTDLHNLFSTQDKAFHATLKRNLASLYSVRGIKDAEPHIDRTVAALVRKLKGYSQSQVPVDMSQWLQWWAFDTIGEINLSHNLGFVEKGVDVDHLCEGSHAGMRYFGLMGQVLDWEKIYANFMSLWSGSRPNPLFELVLKIIDERIQQPPQTVDKIDAFLARSREQPETFTKRDVISATYITLVTAHDVLAITLRAILYYFAKDARVFALFKDELRRAINEQKISSPVQYEEAAQLVYLNAFIMEVLRIHPSTGLIFERIVPDAGVMLHDKFLPPNTVVGVNAWVFNRDPSIFGEDSEDFRPERWLEASPDKLKEMHKWILTFGVGARTCIGKNLAMMEICKLTVELYRCFEFQLPVEWTWQFDGSWLTAQGKMEMTVVEV